MKAIVIVPLTSPWCQEVAVLGSCMLEAPCPPSSSLLSTFISPNCRYLYRYSDPCLSILAAAACLFDRHGALSNRVALCCAIVGVAATQHPRRAGLAQ